MLLSPNFHEGTPTSDRRQRRHRESVRETKSCVRHHLARDIFDEGGIPDGTVFRGHAWPGVGYLPETCV